MQFILLHPLSLKSSHFSHSFPVFPRMTVSCWGRCETIVSHQDVVGGYINIAPVLNHLVHQVFPACMNQNKAVEDISGHMLDCVKLL